MPLKSLVYVYKKCLTTVQPYLIKIAESINMKKYYNILTF